MGPTKRFALCYRSSYTAEGFAIHADGCADLHRERTNMGATVNVVEASDPKAAVGMLIDAELTEMGYDASHVKVYPCCSSVCAGVGKAFAIDINVAGGRRLYAPCPVCRRPFGTGRGTVPRHKAAR
jgi:hypothetical protein